MSPEKDKGDQFKISFSLTGIHNRVEQEMWLVGRLTSLSSNHKTRIVLYGVGTDLLAVIRCPFQLGFHARVCHLW